MAVLDPYEDYLRTKQGATLGDYGALPQVASEATAPNPTDTSIPSKAVSSGAGIGGTALSLLGTGLSAYGAFEQHKQDRADNALTQGHDWARQYQQDAASIADRKRANTFEDAKYANDELDKLLEIYGAVNARTGR